MAIQPLYGVAIRNACATGDPKKMQAMLKKATKAIKEHADLVSAYVELQEALEKAGKKG